MATPDQRGGFLGLGATVPRTPASGHRDAQWYRRASTKSSAESAAQPSGRVSDDAAWAAVSHSIAGIAIYGGLGWLLGLWLGHQEYFAAGGILIGVALALFMVFRRLEPSGPEPEALRDRYGRSAHGGTFDGRPGWPGHRDGADS